MKKSIPNLLFFFFSIAIIASTYGQQIGKKASLNENGSIHIEDILLPEEQSKEVLFDIKEGFPFGSPANASFKNFRGAAVADIDEDGMDEIIFGANSKLFVLKGNGEVLWSKDLNGTIIYPPSIANMNGDEHLEIIVNTGGVPNNGHVYLLDKDGNDFEGWPVSFDQHWMFNAPAIADLNGDEIMEIVTCERGTSTSGFLHVLTLDGTELNPNWPLELPGNLAFTPSIGDINNDGTQNIVISISSGSLYALNPDGSILDGFPQLETNKGYSYQSPMLYDFNQDGTLEIVGARHGDSPDYYMVQPDGSYASGWPITTPSDWRYSPATIVSSINENDEAGIFFGHPNTNGTTPMDVIYGYHANGDLIDGFPINKIGGCESVISVADINADGMKDLIFTNNSTDAMGIGYIHAYSIDGSGELDGFPLRPKGFTFMNSAVVGDIDGDDMLDIACLSYTQFTGNDSIFITAYDLGIPVNQDDIVFNGYKGNLLRDGMLYEETGVGIQHPMIQSLWLELSPNPSNSYLRINYPVQEERIQISILNYLGQNVETISVQGQNETLISTEDYQSGFYFIKIEVDGKEVSKKWLKI